MVTSVPAEMFALGEIKMVDVKSVFAKAKANESRSSVSVGFLFFAVVALASAVSVTSVFIST